MVGGVACREVQASTWPRNENSNPGNQDPEIQDLGSCAQGLRVWWGRVGPTPRRKTDTERQTRNMDSTRTSHTTRASHNMYTIHPRACIVYMLGACFFEFWNGVNFRSGEAESRRQRPHARDNRFSARQRTSGAIKFLGKVLFATCTTMKLMI